MILKFIQATHYTPASGRSIEVVVIHTMEAPEKPETAEGTARWFAGGRNAPEASAHYCVDNNSVVQCVRDQDVAWAAPGCNHNGLQIEHAGYARQSAAEWQDTYSKAMLGLSAQLAARLCQRYGIPVRWLSAADLRAGKRGITSHANVTKAFHKSTHWDPGPFFPAVQYVSMVKSSAKPPLDKPAPVAKPPLDEAIELLEGSAARKRGHRRVVEAIKLLKGLRKS